MKNLTLENLANACGGTYCGAQEELKKEIEGVTTDSREIQADWLFIPIRGARVDGHSFIPQVFAAGAACTLSEEALEDAAGPYIRVDSCEQALKDIAGFYRQQLSIPIVGITGSVGKTSTKEMIASVLSQKYNVLKTEGNFNNEIGMPLTLLKIREEHEAAVIEMGIDHFGEMHRLAAVAQPDICVITNIGHCHLENLGDRDGVLKAKTEIFDFLKPDGAIVLNGNDDKLSTVPVVSGITPTRYFVEDGSAKDPAANYFVTATQIVSHGLLGMEADLVYPDETCHIKVSMPGTHNIYNACAGACVGSLLGLSHEEIAQGIAAAKTIAGRFRMIALKDDIVLIDDCYNANPASMKASLDVLAMAPGRKIAVLGDMGELGVDERALHREVGAFAAQKEIDILLAAGELSKDMVDAAAGVCAAEHFSEKEALIERLLTIVRPGDSVLVKASHFMEYPAIVARMEEAF